MEAKKRGLAALSPERRSKIARLGGKAAHSRGVTYKLTSEKAREIGRIGGKVSRRGPSRKAVQ